VISRSGVGIYTNGYTLTFTFYLSVIGPREFCGGVYLWHCLPFYHLKQNYAYPHKILHIVGGDATDSVG